jgi:hypothetical protein
MIHIVKSQPAPKCLAIERTKKNGTYNCLEVLTTNKSDFNNKCYICEDKEPHVINTEHFIPHKGNMELKLDWNNLFFCCGHCNNTKLAKPIYNNILNCTVETDNVETDIKYWLDPFPKELVKVSAILDNEKVRNTVALLQEVYNGTTMLKQIESANLRTKMLKEIRFFQDLLFQFYDDSYTDDEKLNTRSEIVRQLRPTSNFTSFKRWIIRDKPALVKDFGRDF